MRYANPSTRLNAGELIIVPSSTQTEARVTTLERTVETLVERLEELEGVRWLMQSGESPAWTLNANENGAFATSPNITFPVRYLTPPLVMVARNNGYQYAVVQDVYESHFRCRGGDVRGAQYGGFTVQWVALGPVQP